MGQEIVDIALDNTQFRTQSQQLQDIHIDFCDMPGARSVHYTTSVWKKTPICLHISNNSDADIMVNIWFVDATVTNDERQNEACGLDTDTQIFGQYVSGYNNHILLPKKTSQRQYAYVLYPKDSGVIPGETVQWCFVYALVRDDTNKDLWFDILVRRAKFITLYIEKAPTNYRYFWIILIVWLAIILWVRKRISNRWK